MPDILKQKMHDRCK